MVQGRKAPVWIPSDFDIGVSGAVDVEGLREELEELPTLYKIDLVDLDTCKNELLLEDIREYGCSSAERTDRVREKRIF